MKRFILFLLILLAPTAASAYSFLNSCGPIWKNLPVTYYINQAGSSDVPFNTLTNVISASYAAWEQPCCSNFRSQYGGTTQLTADNNNGRMVLSWEDSQWDPLFGDPNTIGVTLTTVWSDCSISEAPILFNGVNFRFTTSGQGTDLQSIATHEIGHSLGLGHSNVFQSTMYPSYMGGTGARTLHQDDIDGVCALYPKPCTCITTNDCIEGDICQNGLCRNVPCTSDSNCQSGLVCQASTGKCIIPPCTDDASCGAGFTCQANGTCTVNCPVCRSCESNNDCGANAVCIQSGKCVVFCQQGGLCPGDSECYNLQGNYVCSSPDSNILCPDDYTCIEIPSCTSNSDCTPGDSCVAGKCEGPCADITCPQGQICRDSRCYPDLPDENNTNPNNTDPNNTTGNNSTGNNTDPNNSTGNNTDLNNSTGNNGTGNNSNPTGQPQVVVILEEGGQSESCATANGSTSGLILLLMGLGLLRRRR